MRISLLKKDVKALKRAVKRGEGLRLKHRHELQDCKRWLAIQEEKYTETEAFIQIVEEGCLKMVRGSWLVTECRDNRFRRQQDLPDEAFFSAEDLRSGHRVTAIIAISYCWLHAVHPDPSGAHFRVICRAVKLRLQVKGPGKVQDVALFFDYCSLAQHAEHEQGDMLNPVLGVLRTDTEQKSFSKGLGSVNIPYAHQATEVWMVRYVPRLLTRASYENSGWTTFEKSISSLIKDATKLVDIGESCLTSTDWVHVCEQGLVGRMPPQTPDNFASTIATKTFTNGSDVKFVTAKYKETFIDVVGGSRNLWFVNLKWGDSQAADIVEMLPFCEHLEQLFLSENEFTSTGAMSILQAAGKIDTLRSVDLSDNHIEPTATGDIIAEWEKAGKQKKQLRLGQSRQQPGAVTTDARGADTLALQAVTLATLV